MIIAPAHASKNVPATTDVTRLDGSLLPADGTGLPVEPNENFGTFSFEQRTDRQNGLSGTAGYVIAAEL